MGVVFHKGREAVGSHAKQLIFPLVLLFLWGAAFYDAVASAIDVWVVSKTFAHCFLVIPAAVYLAWVERARFLSIDPRPNLWLVFPLFLLMLLGALGLAGDLKLFSHVAAFSSLPLLVWLLVGNSVAYAARFCLVFVLFSIPVGEELVPLFQQITAAIAIYMLGLTDVPFIREGLYLTIPEGRFVVAEACSGIRFFIACIAFGAIYAHISFYTRKLKILYMLACIAVPILANGVRVFVTFLIGHYVGMDYAGGTDHLLFGWVFFAFIMILLVALGEIFLRFEVQRDSNGEDVLHISPVWGSISFKVPVFVASIPIVLFLVWKVYAVNNQSSDSQAINRAALPVVSEIMIDETDWVPKFFNSSESLLAFTSSNHSDLYQPELFIAWYDRSSNDSELIAASHRLFHGYRWSLIAEKSAVVSVEGQKKSVRLLNITNSSGKRRMLMYWYETPMLQSANKVEVKLYQALDKVLGGAGSGAVAVLSVVYDGSYQEAEDFLLAYGAEYYHDIKVSLPLN